MLLVLGTSSGTQDQPLQFRNISVEEGLSQTHARCLYHDPNGFVWIGTQDGLNRYDGYDFKVYRHEAADPFALSDKNIYALAGDSNGKIWVGTANGLDRYDPALDGFEHFPLSPEKQNEPAIRTILSVSPTELWVGTECGLFFLNPESKIASQYLANSEAPRALNANILSIFLDDSDQLWVGTRDGLYVGARNGKNFSAQALGLNETEPIAISSICGDGAEGLWIATSKGLLHYQQQQITQYRHKPADPNSLPEEKLHVLYLDLNKHLWIGTDNMGLCKVDTQTMTFQNYRDTGQAGSLKGKGVWSIVPDPRGGLWLGTFEAGLARAETESISFATEPSLPGVEGSLSNPHVLAIRQAKNGWLWVGTDAGLNRKDPGSKNFVTYRNQPDNPASLSANAVTSILEDRDGQLWFGAWEGGLNLYHPDSDSFTHVKASKDSDSLLSNASVVSLLEGSEHSLWVGTMDGLNLFDSLSGKVVQIHHVQKDTDTLSHPNVFALTYDAKGTLWVGTRQGLNQRLPNGRFRRFMASDSPGELSHGTIVSIHQDAENPHWLWVATPEGLNLFDQNSQKFKVFGLAEGLPNETINSILEDKRHRLWLGTNQGLVVTDKTFDQIRVFDMRDGLATREFSSGAQYQDREGHFYFGTLKGMLQFQPDSYEPTTLPIKTLFSSFLLDNKPILPVARDPHSPLPTDPNLTTTIELNHLQRMVSFGFSANEFSAPWHTRYRYRLTGFDAQWLNTNVGFRRATYTNLPPGSYLFEVNTAAAGGSWSKESASIKLIVRAAPWLTWWAKTIYVLCFLGLIGWYMNIQRVKLFQERELSRQQAIMVEQERATAERLRDLDKLKDQFLANTSHELRTPLNGIIGLADGILGDSENQLEPTTRADLNLIAASGRRLTSLVNDILDFSLLRRGELTLYLVPVNLRALAEMALALNRPLAKDKNLNLKLDIDPDLPPVLADENRLGQILLNLIGNAVKFTLEGEVTVRAQVLDKDTILVSICDTGIGIAPEVQKEIFESFRQADGGISRTFGGTGLGLAITRRLIELHGSQISVASELGKGATFSFQLLTSDDPMPEPGKGIALARLQQVPELQAVPEEATGSSEPQFQTSRQFRIMIVDDEPVNRRVLVNFLKPRGCEIIEASCGEECLDSIENALPDLILLDVMMPGLSGYQVCARLRQKYPLENLPVIFLTARNRVEDMVAAFNSGASDFIPKPVTKEELMVRVHTHLQLLETTRDLDVKVRERTQALIISQKMAGIGTLATGLAHEINNPNNFINGGTQIVVSLLEELQEHLNTSDSVAEQLFSEAMEQLGLIRNGSKRITQVVSYLSLFSKRSTKGKVAVDLTQILQAAIQLLSAQNQKIEFKMEWGQEVKYRCLADELGQAFLNILTNSCEAIRIKKMEMGEPEVIKISYREDADFHIFSFEDNGVGIEKQNLEHIFDAFYTTKRGSKTAGLGLYIAWEVINRHNGHLFIQSEPGKGTQLCAHLAKNNPQDENH